MTPPVLLVLLIAFTLLSGVAIFLRRKLLHAVLFLALASLGSSLLLLYVNQVLVALLQLLVFVGGLSTYLLVAVAAEVKQAKMISLTRFFVVAIVAALVMSLFVYAASGDVLAGNDFSTVAQSAFSTYYAMLFVAVLLLFAVAMCGVVVIKKFSRMVV